MAGGFLHLLEYPFLLVELLLDLRRALQLLRLITAGWALVLDAAVGGLNQHQDLVDPRLKCGHFIFLRDDLSLPLLGGALLGRPLLGRPLLCSLREALFRQSLLG